MEADLQTHLDRIEALEEELEQARDEGRDLERALRASEDQLDTALDVNTALSRDLANTQGELANTEGELAAASEELSFLQSLVDRLEVALGDIKDLAGSAV